MIIVMLVFMFAVTYSYGLFATIRDYFRNRKGLDKSCSEYDRIRKRLDELVTNEIDDFDYVCDLYYRKLDVVMNDMDRYYRGLQNSKIEIIKAIGIVLAIVLIILLMLEWRY